MAGGARTGSGEPATPMSPSPGPAATRWCPNCGAEYRPGFTTCADCGVALVEQPPAPEPAPPSPVALDDHEPAVFDLDDWPTTRRDALTWMLGGQSIPFEWEPPGLLIVPAARADDAEGFIDYLDARADQDDDDPDLETPSLADTAGDQGDEGDTDEPTAAAADVPASLRWLAPRLDALEDAYLRLRSSSDATSAFTAALRDTLEPASLERLDTCFELDPGDGTRAGARAWLARTLERRANWPAG
jgi:hypothetical protein